MSTDTIGVLLGCLATILIVGLALAYIFTSATRKKSECPKCSRKSPAKTTYVINDETGEKAEGDRDFGFAVVSGIGGLLIGIGLCAFVLFMVIPSFGNESCSFEGIVIKCVSYGGNTKVETTINLPIAFIALLGGISTIIRGIARFRRALYSRGKPMTCEFVCTCQNTWTEEIPALE
jgi:hypothetical protein